MTRADDQSALSRGVHNSAEFTVLLSSQYCNHLGRVGCDDADVLRRQARCDQPLSVRQRRRRLALVATEGRSVWFWVH